MPAARRPLLYVAGALSVTALLGLGATAALAGDDVPRGTTVRALELGGLSRDEAAERLTGAFTTERTSPVSLVADGEELALDPRAAGIDLDVAATVDRAADAGPLARLAAVVGLGREVDPVPSVDEAKLRAQLERLAEGFDREPREGSVRFDDKAAPVEVPPLSGRALDVAGAAEAVRESYLSLRVDVPADVMPVETTAEDVRRARETIAEPAVGSPITVTAGGKGVVIEPTDIAKALTVVAGEDGELAPRLDEQVLHERVRERLEVVGTAPVDATFRIEAGKPVLVPSKDGTSISPPDLAAAVREVLTDPAPREAEAPLTPSAPRITTAQARGLGIVEPIGTFTSRHPCCAPRVTNIHRIADILDGYIVKPGEQFDLNGVVGPRDRARGFVPAPQILDGEFVDSVGGGVSQFATALFNAVFFSGLKDVTHSPHSYYISRYPPGREATVSFPKPDLVFENDSEQGVLIDTSYDDTSITVTFYGTKRYDEVRSLSGPRTRPTDFVTQYDQRPTCSATAGSRGFDIVVTRVLVDGGREVGRQAFKTRYKPQPKIVCGPAPAPAPAPGASSPAASPAPSPAG